MGIMETKMETTIMGSIGYILGYGIISIPELRLFLGYCSLYKPACRVRSLRTSSMVEGFIPCLFPFSTCGMKP